MASTFQSSARFEHRFWLQVLGDHSRFIHDSLAPSETKDVEEADSFIYRFDQLLERVNAGDLIELSNVADREAKQIREFKLSLLARHLQGHIKMSLSPTFINHMVNEVEEYIRVLDYLKNGQTPPIFHELHHHLVWLLDAAGHAGAINDNLDQIEKQLKAKSMMYVKDFEAFYLKAVEMTGYLRTNLESFPALTRMNKEVSLEIQLFMNFLNELEELELSAQALGTFAPLMADHMYREECYYLTKVAESASLERPGCDPGKPRIEAE
ncbi:MULTISPECIES: DUF2935 domain-containing protein [Bacillus]|uniref:DUF2935 domain-containing protein n=1 Tax=Bacillus TaxID=1386 RepID=UPI000C76DD74|nr:MULTISPECIES: DUF2935 domain-containing protein [Bacillus]PLR83391.1 hypothetical protein CVD23_14440 [Bacillus sp. V33-4]RSK51751.1 DUF2935 domain-containing protein [Bacillus canaveralius]